MPDRDRRRAAIAEETDAITDATTETRGRLRRKLPLGRAAVLEIDGRPHVVGLVDLSVSGAYVMSRAAAAVGDRHRLRILVLPERVELRLECEAVRVSQEAHESPSHPRGVAYRFLEMDEGSLALLQAFVARDPRRPR
jgi:hypothetical protein